MPNKNTFSIKPIREVIDKYHFWKSIDPFANSNKIANITNDIDPQYWTDFNLDAIDFLKTFQESSVDTVLFDPPFSPRQVSECYKKMWMTVNMQTTQSSFRWNLKKEIQRVTKKWAIVMSFGWNSWWIGKTKWFEQIEILIVAHWWWHNDTIVTVERKL